MIIKILMIIFTIIILIFGAILFCSLDEYAKRIRRISKKVTEVIELNENYFNSENNEEMAEETIRIKYFADIDKVKKINEGDLIDLRASEDVELKAGEYKLIPLGVGMKLPKGYKANVYPRSSTPKNFGIIMGNSVGQIDQSFSGNEDQWHFPAIAFRDTVIHKNDRICQFEIQKIQPTLKFIEVDKLDNNNRGSFGSTGVN